MKPHVTWDEEQIAEHDKTRGQKMKIDEPKTPYVTEEEFQKLCDKAELVTLERFKNRGVWLRFLEGLFKFFKPLI